MASAMNGTRLDDSATAAVHSGLITVFASAKATGDDAKGDLCDIAGIYQDVSVSGGGSGSGSASAYNSGTIDVTPKSTMTASNGDAMATATNAGGITVLASAVASGEDADADVSDVEGIHIKGNGSDTLTVEFHNSGSVLITATADAQADASGGDADADADEAAGVRIDDAGVLEGTLVNSGSIDVSAYASASGEEASADARAVGLRIQADGINATMRNEGIDARIMAFASATATGDDEPDLTAEATAVLFEDHSSERQEHGPGEGLLVNNSGMIWAGIGGLEEDDPEIVRATAIDTKDATHSTIHQEWKGEKHWGRIFGDVNIKEDETITVSDGLTKFNGVVNNWEEGNLVGEMTIIGTGDGERDPGALFLAMGDSHAPQQLAPQVNVDSFTQEAGATLWFEINAPEDDIPVGAGPSGGGDYIGQINGDDVSLDGDAVLRVVQPQVFPNAFTYEDVVTADNGTGAWDSLTSWTPLLDPTDVYNGDWGTGAGTSVDIDVYRVPFHLADLDGVGGYTDNTYAVGGGLEGGYPAVLAGTTPEDFDLPVGTLFTLNAEEYAHALNQLTGSIYAQGLWSITNSLDMFKRAENVRTKSGYWESPDRKLTFWLNGQLAWADVDGDENAPGFDHDRQSIHAGVDYLATDGLTIGAGIGYFAADLDFDEFGADMAYDGIQIGLYGEYEFSNWHVNVIGAYGDYDGSSKRNVNIDRVQDPMECGCIPDIGLDSVNKGSIGASAWLLSGEVGHTFEVGEQKQTEIAPYVGLTYQSGELDSFSESATGSASGSALKIDIDYDRVLGVDQIVGGIGEAGRAAQRPGPLRRRVRGRDELRRDLSCGPEGGVIEGRQIVLHRLAGIGRDIFHAPFMARHRTLLVGIRLNEARIDREALAADQTLGDYARDRRLEHLAQHVALPEPAMPVARESRVVRDTAV